MNGHSSTARLFPNRKFRLRKPGWTLTKRFNDGDAPPGSVLPIARQSPEITRRHSAGRTGGGLLVLTNHLRRGAFARVETETDERLRATFRESSLRLGFEAILPVFSALTCLSGLLFIHPSFALLRSKRPYGVSISVGRARRNRFFRFPSTQYRMTRRFRRSAASSIQSGALALTANRARDAEARRRAMPARVSNGQQNDYRCIPSRGDSGCGAARQ